MFNFGEGHKEYIRRCRFCTFNILEGAVRSGKTVDNVFAFAQELKTTPDKIHLATGSTMGNAKLNIGDANGFGLEWIFRGQCHWGKYKDMEALIINGPYTNFKQKVVIFAGASSSDSFKKIRGNSYGMWIATEINLHHDTAIKEAFNRQLAAKNRKIFWDMNPEHPKAPIYENYLDVYDQKAKDGTLKGGYNYAHFTIFENVNITKERLEEIVSQYDENSIWYVRDILGKRSIAEGLVYTQFASLAAMANNPMKITVAQAQEMIKRNELQGITIGVDFGGNGSGHSFVASAPTVGYCGNGKLVHASINEKGTTTGGKSGDQTGREICIRSYYNKPWKYVYRYTGEVSNAGTVSVRNYLQKGDSGDAVKEMQKMLIGCGYSCGKSGVDGSFGGDTEKALLAFQEFYALEVDGKYGPASKAKLTSVYNGKQSAAAPELAKSPQYTVGKAYTLQVELKVRTGPGTNYAAKKHSQLTADGQKHDKDNDGCLDAGTVITCKEVNVIGNDVWIKAPSGWMAGYYNGQVFIK